jgi:nucleotide-binding universal stress UspA family protein
MGGFTVPYRRVVVPVDCSPRSDWSLALAAAVARGCGASLKVVHVLDRPQVLSRLPSSGAAERLVNRLVDMNRVEAQRYLEEAVWRLGGRGLKVEAQILDPSAPEAAVGDLASASDSDLVVLSAHGRGASADLPFGGNAAKMIFWGRSPVLVLQDLPVKRRFSEEPTRLEGPSRLARALRAEHQITAQPQ